MPEHLIAHVPPKRRDDARLLVVHRATGILEHRTVRDLPNLLQPGDCLALNDTRVVPARLYGRRAATGGKWEGLYLGCTADGLWRLIGHTRGSLKPGEQIVIVAAHDPASSDELVLTLAGQDPEGVWTAQPRPQQDALALLEKFGTVPLPPYIARALPDRTDRERYQTVFADRPGAVAAPTAGLHFTDDLLADCAARGIAQARVTLHVGIGTFRPIATGRLSEHRMHREWCELSPASAENLNDARGRGGRIVAVGTTCVRTLETAAASGVIQPFRGETDLFIRPPYQFRAVDVLLTNFHLPKSTLFVLVCTLAGRELTHRAYESAIAAGYRFYSYGDAMLVV